MFRIPNFHHSAGTLLLAVIAHASSMGVSQADDGASPPKIPGSHAIGLQNELTFSFDDETKEFNTSSAKIEPALTLFQTDQLSINARLPLETAQVPAVEREDRG